MIREAAHLMVSSLAGSLALVTCREPLRVSLTSHLRSLLNPGGSSKDVRAAQKKNNDNNVSSFLFCFSRIRLNGSIRKKIRECFSYKFSHPTPTQKCSIDKQTSRNSWRME